jgi:hypothetical protein
MWMKYCCHCLNNYLYKIKYAFSQSDNVQAHNAESSVWVLQVAFNGGVTTSGLWPSQSFDINVCNICGVIWKRKLTWLLFFERLVERNIALYSRNHRGRTFNLCHRICYVSMKCSLMLEDSTLCSCCIPSGDLLSWWTTAKGGVHCQAKTQCWRSSRAGEVDHWISVHLHNDERWIQHSNRVCHCISTSDVHPICQSPYRLPWTKQTQVHKILRNMKGWK